ncbi:MAG: hypothetical protein RL264_1538 [Bacteroidota bacterium]|jgi:transcriptional antiterminator
MHLEKIKRLLHLIERKQTGKPAELAQKLGVSRRMIYNYFKLVKEELGVPLAFDNYKQSFIFPYSGRICWEFSAKAQKQTPCNQFKNKQLRTLCQLVQLLHLANTGSSKQLATTLHISNRTLFHYLDLLKTVFHCPIRFDHQRNSYVFENEGTINFLWENTDCNLVAQT